MVECGKLLDREARSRGTERRAWVGMVSSLLTILAGVLARATGHM